MPLAALSPVIQNLAMDSTPVHPAELPIPELLKQCDVTRTKRSGPGGQHRNKVESAIVLEHRPSGVLAEASERRSQAENLDVALERLRRALAIVVRTSRSSPAEPSPLWRSRLKGTRIEVSGEHFDYPILLAESLDRLAQTDWNVSALAQQLGTTLSQLVRFWKKEPLALVRVNTERERRGYGRLS